MSTKWMDAIKSFTDGVKQGVLTNNMKLIQDSLEEFMGEELAGMSVKEINKESDDEKEVGKTTEKDGDDFTMPVSEDTEGSRQRLTKRKSLDLTADRENQFTDDGTIKIDEAGADLIDDTVKNPVKRTRKPAAELISITCHICEKVESVHPSLHKEHYRCDSCCKG
mgnify:CR=1 FL=1